MRAQRLPQQVDVLGQIGFLDVTVRPDPVEQLALRDDATSPFDQRDERLDGLRRESQRNAVEAYRPVVGVEAVRTKFKDAHRPDKAAH